MGRGWLRSFARADGRALARALAALLFLSVFVTGLHGGFAAVPGASAAVLCHGDNNGSSPATPAADHEHDCCLPGAASAAPNSPVLAGRAPFASALVLPAPEGQLPPSHGAVTRAGPRAPPLLPA